MEKWIVPAIVAALFYFIILEPEYLEPRRRQQEEAKCLRTPSCQDMNARIESDFSESGIARSTTGKVYYKGNECSGDCVEFIRGYEAASSLGMTQEDACHRPTLSQSNTAGCVAAVEDRMAEIEANVEARYEQD
ncbi:hypothetical protein [Solimonas sp. SE-A11]|uniref:hypothetical protein n=1 Tax=Solimonas sp. SE-A11 TaxID=3054954 RepID=UPI00259CD5B6|nr:hypothetical protein [Solimonas sp. SE-A11]MDM4772428.1 hypothetical protein [Solimonas sp. SE-A11]